MPSPFWVHIILPLLAEIFMPHLASVPYLVSGITSFHTFFSLASFSDNLVQTFFFFPFSCFSLHYLASGDDPSQETLESADKLQ